MQYIRHLHGFITNYNAGHRHIIVLVMEFNVSLNNKRYL